MSESIRRDYNSLVVSSSSVMRDYIDTQIAAGKLPPDYTLPPAERLGATEITFRNTYDQCEAAGRSPRIVWVPMGLDVEQWEGLLGAIGRRRADLQSWLDVRKSDAMFGLWHIAIFDDLPETQSNGVSAGARMGLLPSPECYMAAQLSRIANGQECPDQSEWSLTNGFSDEPTGRRLYIAMQVDHSGQLQCARAAASLTGHAVSLLGEPAGTGSLVWNATYERWV